MLEMNRIELSVAVVCALILGFSFAGAVPDILAVQLALWAFGSGGFVWLYSRAKHLGIFTFERFSKAVVGLIFIAIMMALVFLLEM